MLITEISERDFRKLNLTVYKHEWKCFDSPQPHQSGRKLTWVSYKINDLLDKEISYAINNGYESDRNDLNTPVTIAIHVNNYNKSNREHTLGGGYFDKYMNQFLGETTYYIGWGIKHLYSTRDYYEDHDDYWRIKKKETEVIYRVHLEPRPFVLKHRAVKISGSDTDYILSNQDLVNGEWVEISTTRVVKDEHSTKFIPVE